MYAGLTPEPAHDERPVTAELQNAAEELVEERLLNGVDSRPYDDLVREVVELEEADLVALRVAGPEHSQTQVKHIRAYHHMVALRLALGERPIQICASIGLTPQTITRLQNSPQFAELVESYRGRVIEKAIDHAELMSTVSAEALSAIMERLDSDERENIPIEMLRRLAETFVDRIGHSPVRRSESSTTHRVELGAEALERIKTLHSERRRLEDHPTVTIEASYSKHEEDSRSSGALESAAACFQSAQGETSPQDPDAGSGECI